MDQTQQVVAIVGCPHTGQIHDRGRAGHGVSRAELNLVCGSGDDKVFGLVDETTDRCISAAEILHLRPGLIAVIGEANPIASQIDEVQRLRCN